MKKSAVIIISSLMLAFGAGIPMSVDCQAAPAKVTKKSVKDRKGVKALFQSSIGQYPFDVKLLQNTALKTRLVKLMGQKRYLFMTRNFDVQSPVEFESWNYHTNACQAHMCGTTEFEISYNPEEDALAVRYRVDGKEQIFKEKPSVNAYWDFQ